MRKIIRDYRQMCRDEGLVLLEVESRSGGHYALHFERGVVFTSSTPSDFRVRLNLRSKIRRLHQ